jgi:hypothetical protein
MTVSLVSGLFTAVSPHAYLEVPRQRAGCLPGELLEIAYEGTLRKAPILLERADKIPAIIAEPLAKLF